MRSFLPFWETNKHLLWPSTRIHENTPIAIALEAWLLHRNRKLKRQQFFCFLSKKHHKTPSLTKKPSTSEIFTKQILQKIKILLPLPEVGHHFLTCCALYRSIQSSWRIFERKTRNLPGEAEILASLEDQVWIDCPDSWALHPGYPTRLNWNWIM